jgi:predicted nucleic acid-binding Zn ribbon protein
MNQTCPYCLSPIAEHDEVKTCEVCKAVYHSECWQENGGCSAKSCPSMNRRIEIDFETDNEVKSSLILTREEVESSKQIKSINTSNPCVRCGRQVPSGELFCDKCKPVTLLEHDDVKNLGPILIMLAVLGVLLAWIIVVTVSSPNVDSESQPPSITDRLKQ